MLGVRGLRCAGIRVVCRSPVDDATDLTTPSACDAISTLTIPALGRAAGAGAHAFGATQHPAAPNITLDGTSTDSLGFGPAAAPTAGVADFDAR